jgi:hypothetical protein
LVGADLSWAGADFLAVKTQLSNYNSPLFILQSCKEILKYFSKLDRFSGLDKMVLINVNVYLAKQHCLNLPYFIKKLTFGVKMLKSYFCKLDHKYSSQCS